MADVQQRHKRKSRRETGTSASSRPKKVKMMNESGQTDAERRRLRSDQRELQKRIISSELGQSIEDPNSEAFSNIREDNNRLFDDVKFTREAVLDGENLDLISTRTKRQIDHLVQVPQYDATMFARMLKNQCTTIVTGNRVFDWKKLGREAGACFNAVPSRISFMHGPMDVNFTPKERKKPQARRRKKDVEGEEEKPEEVSEKERQAGAVDKLSAVEKSMDELHKTLKRRCKEEFKTQLEKARNSDADLDPEAQKKLEREIGKKGICGVKFLFNPKSFTQTVENIFSFSFLVKKGSAGIFVEDDKERGTKRPMLRMTAKNDKSPPPAKQAIVAFTMRDWKMMCKEFDVDKSDVPHRTGSKHTRKGKNRDSLANEE